MNTASPFVLPGIPPLPSLGAQAARRASTQLQIDPADEETIARKAFRMGVGGISAAGNFLDLPGSMVRDVVTGHNPLDQLLHPFSGENRMTGRDVARQWGLAGSEDTWGNFAGGLGLEVALDPLTYIFPLGAMTKGGQALKKANLLDNVIPIAARKLQRPVAAVGKREALLNVTTRDVLRQASRDELRAAHNVAKGMGVKLSTIADDPLRGMFATGFMGKVGNVGGFGARGQKVARALDTLGETLQYARIPGTDVQPINAIWRTLSAPLADTRTKTGQVYARRLFNRRTAAHAEAQREIAGYIDELREAGHATDAQADQLREFLESPVTGVAPPELEPLIEKLQFRQAHLLEQLQAKGVAPKEWSSPYALHWPRHMTARLGRGAGGAGGGTWSTFSGGMSNAMRRLWFLQPTADPNHVVHAIRGETATIKQILQDPHLEQIIEAGGNRRAIEAFIGQQYGHLVPKEAWIKQGGQLVKRNRHRALGKWIEGMDPELRAAGMFGNHPLLDFQAQLVGAKDALEASDAVRDLLTTPGVRRTAQTANELRETVDIKRVLQALRIKPGDHTGGFAMSLADAAGQGQAIRAAAAIDPATAQTMLKGVLDFRIDKSLAADLKNFRQPFTHPKPVHEILRALDSVTNLWKGYQTAIWPAFHTRNFVSGQYQNYVAGMFSFESVAQTKALLQGKVVRGASQWDVIKRVAREQGITHLDDAAATNIIGQLAYANGLSHRFAGEAMTMTGAVTNLQPGLLSDVMREIPGAGVNHLQPGRILRKAAGRETGTSLNPAAVRGWFGSPQSSFGPMAAGEELSGVVESFNRISPFIHQLKQGIDPVAAARKIGAAQVMYQSRYYTPAEITYLKRLFPFYSFSSRVMPWTLRQLAEKPSGRLAQTLRAVNRLRNPDVLTPDYVSETTAIPLGEDPSGGQRYLTGAGLMFEDALSFLGGGVRGGLLEAGSRLNPLAKLPLEWGFNQTMFQKGPMGGRNLEDLDPTIGRTLANLTGRADPVRWPGSEGMEFVLGNSPMSRALATGRAMTYPIRTLTDPQMAGQFLPELGKTATNLLTGARVTTVSPAAREGMLRERASQLMRRMGGKTFVRSYIPAEVEAEMTPAELADAKKLEALMNTLAKRSKVRAAERKAAEKGKSP